VNRCTHHLLLGAAVHATAGAGGTHAGTVSGPLVGGRDYVKVSGRWRYVYRAIDQFEQVIDVYVSPRRDGGAARRFFTRALATTKVVPVEVITDKAAV
jgi:hypothetical protein